MPSRDSLPAIGLVLIALLLAAGNLWYTSVRSLIPVQLEATVALAQRFSEKKAGVDDVYLLTLANGETVQVDHQVFSLIKTGDTISKDRWASVAQVSSQTVALDWSDDVRGMIWVMPACIVLLALQMLSLRHGRPETRH